MQIYMQVYKYMCIDMYVGRQVHSTHFIYTIYLYKVLICIFMIYKYIFKIYKYT